MPQCLQCNKHYSSKSNLNAHICKPIVMNDVQPVKKMRLKLVRKQFKADCGLEFPTLHEVKLHSDNCTVCDSVKAYTCSFCNMRFKHRNSLGFHKRKCKDPDLVVTNTNLVANANSGVVINVIGNNNKINPIINITNVTNNITLKNFSDKIKLHPVKDKHIIDELTKHIGTPGTYMEAFTKEIYVNNPEYNNFYVQDMRRKIVVLYDKNSLSYIPIKDIPFYLEMVMLKGHIVSDQIKKYSASILKKSDIAHYDRFFSFALDDTDPDRPNDVKKETSKIFNVLAMGKPIIKPNMKNQLKPNIRL